MNKTNQIAILAVDLINDMIHPDGKLAKKGYSDFWERAGALDKIAGLFERSRQMDSSILHVHLQFSPGYLDFPNLSPLFGGAKKFGALAEGEWGTKPHDQLLPTTDELVIRKRRVSPFFGTSLELTLNTLGVKELVVVGVATDLGVQSAAKDAHDRDYAVTVLSDCCIAANDDDHRDGLRFISKIASVVESAEFLARFS